MRDDEKERLLKYLQDALSAADEIYMDTVGLGSQNFYFNNIKWIVERGIEIISEALKRAIVIDPNLPISDLNKFLRPEIKYHTNMML